MNRRLRALVGLGAATVFLGFLAASPVHAEDAITTQPYVEILNLNNREDIGLTGKGVTVAVIDGMVDTSAPELEGADITVVTPCPFTPSDESRTHATAMASLLASKNYGIAPGVKIINYALAIEDADIKEDPTCGLGLDKAAKMALDDGADIISFSVIGETRISSDVLLTRGDRNGAIFVGGMGNDSKEDDERSFASANLTVGVAATDFSGTIADYSNYGKGTTVAAMGGPIKLRSYSTNTIEESSGTSAATAIVSGYLALAKEQWPNATNRQLIQSLVKTAVRDDGVEWDPRYGYGLANLGGLITQDPTTLPDENPLMNKNPEWAPKEDFYNDYVAGVLEPPSLDPDYIYRGTNTTIVKNNPANTFYGTSPRYHADR
ncbi:S8 family peptidase [Schaalia vaccimaxillae]|uniref:S8 family peptidase n=1 Tax=Schaalia vaccimaxillae TaxID=183916 RepID=UPI00103D1DC7|nr:S8 family serine peptidase [Schaalia vaccimaxillae]